MNAIEKTICDRLIKLLDLFGGISNLETSVLKKCIHEVVGTSENCFSRFSSLPKKINFNQTHHSIYIIYNISRLLYAMDYKSISEKLYLVNRMINGIDLYFTINMPKHFLIGHGLGTVFSKSKYGEYLVVFQNVTIGNSGGFYPEIGSKVVIYPNSVISGKTIIGDNSVISAGAVIINEKIPPGSIVFGGGASPLIIKENIKSHISLYFET